MLILLFVVFVALFVLGSVFIDEYDLEWLRFVTQACTVIGAAISIIALIVVCISYGNTRVVDDKIAMYMEENEKIETQIDTIVTEYMKYENETFEGLKGDSSITLVSLYPELKSDELVKTQIKTYQDNNNKIKELKELKINASVYRWWIYFGK